MKRKTGTKGKSAKETKAIARPPAGGLFSMYFKKFFLLNQQKFLTVFVKYANIQKCVGEEITRTKQVKKSAKPG